MLEASHLTKRFGGLTALDNLSFELNQGEILSLIGPNGAGKTTVFNCLTGVIPTDEGRIRFEGQTITGRKPPQIAHLGLTRTFQIVKPFLTISVLDNVLVGALMREKSIPRARREALKILDFMGLAPTAELTASTLPLPQRKKLEMARALATQPRALLLDEVMGGLNPAEVDEMIGLVREINQRGVSILLIEHVMRGVMALSQRVIVINYGRMIAEGVPDAVVKQEAVIEAYLGKEFLNAQG